MNILRPLCPACQARTMLARISPGPFGFDIRTFECPACGAFHQSVTKLVDRMKSLKRQAGSGANYERQCKTDRW